MNTVEENKEEPKIFRLNNNRVTCRLTLVANLDFIPLVEVTNSSALITIKAKWLCLLFSFQRAK